MEKDMPLGADDRFSILELLSRYNWSIDGRLERAAEVWAETFIESGCFRIWSDPAIGVLRRDPNPVVEGAPQILTEVCGRAELRAYAEKVQAARPRSGFHHVDNIVINGDGDRAEMMCYLRSVLAESEGACEEVKGNGYYRDEIQRVAGEWRFATRNLFVPAL
jgi:hypothetical protein